MKQLLSLSLLTLAALSVSCSSLSSSSNFSSSSKSFNKISFDQFFGKEIKSLPLQLKVPANYIHADGLTNQASHTYWMPQSQIWDASQTGKLPIKTGYIHGQISLNEGFDRKTGKFTSEDKIETQFEEHGMTVVDKWSFVANGHPVLSHIVSSKTTDAVVCQMYVATLIEGHVLYISYRPPNNNLALGKNAWRQIIDPLLNQELPEPEFHLDDVEETTGQ